MQKKRAWHREYVLSKIGEDFFLYTLELETIVVQSEYADRAYSTYGGNTGLAELVQILAPAAQGDTSFGVDRAQIYQRSMRLFPRSVANKYIVKESHRPTILVE